MKQFKKYAKTDKPQITNESAAKYYQRKILSISDNEREAGEGGGRESEGEREVEEGDREKQGGERGKVRWRGSKIGK